jgi:exosortase
MFQPEGVCLVRQENSPKEMVAPAARRFEKIVLLLVLSFGFVLAYYPVWKELVLTWHGSDDYSHGFFVVPVVLYALWCNSEKLAKLPIQPSCAGLILLIVSLVLYIIAFYADIKTVAALAMIASITGIVIYLHGMVMFREISLLLLLLLFMIPVPAQLYAAMTMPLQLIVSQTSVWFSMLIGIPIFREGNVIYLPERTLEVVQACSGLRSLMSLLTISLIISYFALHYNKLRVALLLSGIPVAIAVNIVRVIVMISGFYYFGYDLTQGVVHTVIGAAIFILAIFLLFLVKGVLSFWDRSVVEE